MKYQFTKNHRIPPTPEHELQFREIILSKHRVLPSGCWKWLGSKNKAGYGRIFLDGYNYAVHQKSYQVFNGEIGDRMCICHTCDNPFCVNPGHLFMGTHKDNVMDSISKGRFRKTKAQFPHPVEDQSEYEEVHKVRS